MTACEQIQEELALMDDAVEVRSDVHLHLDDCASCRALEAQLRRMRDDVAALPTPPMPEDFNLRMMAAAAPILARSSARSSRVAGLRQILGQVVDALLGGSPSPLRLREVAWSGGLAGAMMVACTFMIGLRLCAGVDVGPLASPTVATLASSVPHLPVMDGYVYDGLENSTPVLLNAFCLLTFVLVARCLRLRRFLARLRRETVPPAAVALTSLSVAASYVVLCGVAVFFERFSRGNSFGGWLDSFGATGAVLPLYVWCAASWWMAVRDRMRNVVFVAAVFYAALLASYAGNALMQVVWHVADLARGNWQSNWMQVLRPTTVAEAVYAVTPLCAALLICLASLCGGAVQRAWNRRLILAFGTACGIAVLLWGTLTASDARAHLGAQNLVEAAALDIQPDLPRTAVLLSSCGNLRVACDRSGTLTPDNCARLDAFARTHPGHYLAAQALDWRIKAAVCDWDLVGTIDATERYLLAPGSSNVSYELIHMIAGSAPRREMAARLHAMFSDRRFYRSPSYGTLWRRAFLVVDGPSEGTVTGRLLSAGRPLGRVRVRLLSQPLPHDDRNGPQSFLFRWVARLLSRPLPYDDPQGHAEEMLHVAADTLRREAVSNLDYPAIDPMIATVTDTNGRFRFTELGNQMYVLAVLLDGRPTLSADARTPLAIIDGTHRAVHLGDVDLRLKP